MAKQNSPKKALEIFNQMIKGAVLTKEEKARLMLKAEASEKLAAKKADKSK